MKIDPDLKAEWVRHATAVGLAFCVMAVICIVWELANGG